MRTALRVTEVFLGGLAACVSVYLLFGHRLLTAAYFGKALPLLNRLARDHSLPLGQYLAKVDERFILYAVTAFTSFFFYLFLVLVVRRLLKNDAGSTRGTSLRSSGVRMSEVSGALLIYSLLTMAFFYSVIPHIASRLIGPPADNMQSLWYLWWTRQALHGSMDFLYTTRIFYPEGSSLLFSLSLYNQLLGLVAGRLLNQVTVYNLLILSTFVISATGAFLMIRHITNDVAAALLGGVVFAFSPSHFAHSLHHLSIATVQFIPLFVLYYLKTLEDGSKRSIAWASVFFLLNTLTCWDYMVYALFFMAACYCITAYRRKRLLMPAPIIASLVIVGSTLVILSPLVIRMLASASRHPNVWAPGHDALTVDILGLLVPHYLHWSAGIPLVARINDSYAGMPWEGVGYLGVLCVGLVLASRRVLATRAARYVLGLLFFLMLSFGTNLQVMGRPIASVLPYAFIQHIPILSGARAPGRIMPYAYLFLGVLVAAAFSYQRREGFLRGRKWVAALLALGICADYWTPVQQMTAVRLPPAYAAIQGQEHAMGYGVLDLPGGRWFRRARYMMYQTLHGIPIVQGYLARKPATSLVDRLEYTDLPVQREQLRSAQVKYIVIHKSILARETDEAFKLDLGRYAEEYQMFFEDEENLVLRVY